MMALIAAKMQVDFAGPLQARFAGEMFRVRARKLGVELTITDLSED